MTPSQPNAVPVLTEKLATLTEAELREKFEAWWSQQPIHGEQVQYKTPGGRYYQPETNYAWQGWLALARHLRLVGGEG